jgi:hypothetical protein
MTTNGSVEWQTRHGLHVPQEEAEGPLVLAVGFGRIVVSETEAPNTFVNLV